MKRTFKRIFSKDRTIEELNSGSMSLIVERVFKIRERKTTIMNEINCGILHFVSCAFILAVNPTLLEPAGFSSVSVAAGTALATGVSCIINGLFSNLPFVLAPTTSTSIYFSLFLQNRGLSTNHGNVAVFFLGVLYCLCGIRPVAVFISNIIPFVIKVGVCLGVGLLIALEALIEIGLVRSGENTVLDIGNFTIEIYIAMFAFVIIGLALHYRVRGSFLIGLGFGTLCYWLIKFLGLSSERDDTPWPSGIMVMSDEVRFSLVSLLDHSVLSDGRIHRLVFDLFIIGMILLNGLAHGLAETSGLIRSDQSLPRGKWLYAACGLGTMFASFLGCGPIMISPESAPGIKAGGRTGLSTVICGFLFLISAIFCPIFAATPASGSSPVLLMIGMMLFENAKNVNWSTVKEALPVFLMAIFIPFTFSIFNGVVFGYGIYLILFIFTDYEIFTKKMKSFWRKLKRIRSSSPNYQPISLDEKKGSQSGKPIGPDVLPSSPQNTSKKTKKDSRQIHMSSSIEEAARNSKKFSSVDSENDPESDSESDHLPLFSSSENPLFLSFELNEINDGCTSYVDNDIAGNNYYGGEQDDDDESIEYTVNFGDDMDDNGLFQGLKINSQLVDHRGSKLTPASSDIPFAVNKGTSIRNESHPLHPNVERGNDDITYSSFRTMSGEPSKRNISSVKSSANDDPSMGKLFENLTIKANSKSELSELDKYFENMLGVNQNESSQV